MLKRQWAVFRRRLFNLRNIGKFRFNKNLDQPDGKSVLYVQKGDLVDITVEVKRGGSDFKVQMNVTVEMVHPICFVLNKTFG